MTACAWLMTVAVVGQAAAAQLSPAQIAAVTKQIGRLKYSQERTMARSWDDAKKAAEFLCRPLAITALRQQLKGADRVFLGDAQQASLRLVNESQLTGRGQVRNGSAWQTFDFSCTLDPKSGKATRFEPRFTSARGNTR